jgi:hypothetical protein
MRLTQAIAESGLAVFGGEEHDTAKPGLKARLALSSEHDFHGQSRRPLLAIARTEASGNCRMADVSHHTV